jgi:ribosomal protein S21
MQVAQKLATNDSSNPITLSAIGIGLLSLATMLGVRLQRGLQPATIIASSGGLGPLMLMNTASALGDNLMEMQLPAVPETRPAQQVKSNRVGWGQLSSQDSCPLPRVALNSIQINTRQGESVDSVIMRLRREVNKSGHLRTLRHKRFHEDAREKKKRKKAEALRKKKFMRQRKSRSMQQGP